MARALRRRREGSAGAIATDAPAPLQQTQAMAVSTSMHLPAQGEPSVTDRNEKASPAAEALQGCIDEANGKRITGWIWNRLHPGEPIAVELIAGNTRLASVMANQYRSDLRQAGIGDGRHAFTIPLGMALLPQARHVLHLRCADTGAELPGSPVVIERAVERGGSNTAAPALYEPAVPSLPAAASEELVIDSADEVGEEAAVGKTSEPVALGGADANPPIPGPRAELHTGPGPVVAPTLQSNIDFADWTGVKGWIWDPQEPDKRIALDLLDGETRLATVLATEYREDLEAAGIGDGRHGFSVPFSETLL